MVIDEDELADLSMTPYARYVEALEMRHDEGWTLHVRREMQVALHDALWAHARDDVTLPKEMAIELLWALGELIAGRDTDLFKASRDGRGAPSGWSPIEEECIRGAVRYHRTVMSGAIDDDKYVATIQAAFGGSDPMAGGVARRTVQGWLRSPNFADVEPYSPERAVAWLGFCGNNWLAHCSKAARKRRAKK